MYEAKKFDHLLGTPGFSDALLTNHFGLYEGYVANTNKIESLLESKESGTPEYSELQRRFGWEWNGMRLHELYFGNLTKEAGSLGEGTLLEKIKSIYGSFDVWQKNFVNTGAMRGIGWVVLVHDKESGELDNLWIDEHNTGHFVGATPLLVMDVFEHAFILDYGMKRAEYIAAFMGAIDWKAVEGRLVEK